MRRSTPTRPPEAAPLRGRAHALALAVLALAAIVGLGACNSSPSKRQLQYMNQDGPGKRYYGVSEEEQYVTPGDTLTIVDVNHPADITLNRKVQVDGTILVPEVGRVNIAGYTRSEVESILTQRLAPYYDDFPPEVVVDISLSKRVFFVIGEVTAEGEFAFSGNQTVFEAVVAAKPMQDSANLGRILLIRPDPLDPLVLQFNFKDYVPGGDSSTNYRLQENDVVYVPPTLVAEFGYFLRGLLFPVTTVFQAIGGALFATQGGRGGGRNRNNRAVGLGGIF